jgi:translocator protein
MKNFKIIPFIFSIALCFLAGAIGSLFTYSEITNWYASLQKPFFNPPNWIFGPVWSLLYLLMGIALYEVWTSQTKTKKKKLAITYFFIQLVLNSLWSILFFGLHSPFLAFLEILVLATMIVLTIQKFFYISKVAAWLMIPYLAWVCFATVLNLSIVLLNS